VFWPPPEVDSALLAMLPRPDAPSRETFARLSRFVKLAFSQRRKQLPKVLKPLADRAKTEAALVSLGHDPRSRAEHLSADDWLALVAAC
jgi:16S rRNA (adenine1518-N6/adenine1519-N6)-dimethyltransferase